MRARRRSRLRARRRSSSARAIRASATAASGGWRRASWTRWRRWSCPRSATASATTSASSSSGSRTAGRSSSTTTGCSSATLGAAAARRRADRALRRPRRVPPRSRRQAARRVGRHAARSSACRYDSFIVGHRTDTVNTLRLWSARATRDFDLQFFNEGDYRRAVEEKIDTENISKVLYPNDQTEEGQGAAAQAAVLLRRLLDRATSSGATRSARHSTTSTLLPDKVAIQLNDTHPAIAVAELMRVLVDEEGLDWERPGRSPSAPSATPTTP